VTVREGDREGGERLPINKEGISAELLKVTVSTT